MLHITLFGVATTIFALARAAPNLRRDQEKYIVSTQTCISKHRPGQLELATVPCSTRTSYTTVSQTVTTCGTSTITTTVTPEPVISTTTVDDVDEANLKRRQQTISVTITSEARQACSTTTTTVSEGVSTVYTGEFNGTLARRTASPMDDNISLNEQRHAPLHQVLHRYGHSAFAADQKPFEVDCLAQVTTYLVTTSTIQEQPFISTITAATPTQTVTVKNLIIDEAATNPPVVSITTTITEDASPSIEPSSAGGEDVCTTTVTTASVTTTQHLKCAPTNLISSLNGHGIGQTQGSSSNTRGLAPGEDPSACCQLCMDTEDCAASENDPDAGNCFLWYTTPRCGLGFSYAEDQKLAPGEGFWVQGGCGWIESVTL